MNSATTNPAKLTGMTSKVVLPLTLLVETGVPVPEEVGVPVTSSVVKGTSVTKDADGKAGGCVDKAGFGVKVVVILPWLGFKTLIDKLVKSP